jgi:hypothetical protein
MDTSHQRPRQATINMLSNSTHLKCTSNTPKDRSRSRRTPHKTLTKASNLVLLLPNTNPLNSHKQTPRIHLTIPPRVRPVNRSMLNTKILRVQVSIVSLPGHLVTHLMNPIDNLPNLV